MLNIGPGMLQPAGIGLIINLTGALLIALAAIGICRARRRRVATVALTIALIGIAIMICGTGVVIAAES